MPSRIMRDVPVLPYVIHPQGQPDRRHVLSFYDLHNPHVSEIGGDHREVRYGICETSAQVASLSLLTDLGFTNTVSVGLRAKSRVHLFLQETLFHKKVDNPLYTGGESAIRSMTLGLGFRLAIACWDVQAEAKLGTASGIASSAKLGMLSSQFDVQMLGADADALKFFVPVISKAGGGFGLDELLLLEKATQELTRYFGDVSRQRELRPSILRVDVDFDRVGSKNGRQPLKHVLASEMYALFMVAHQRFSPDQALAHSHNNPKHWPKAWLTEDLVRKAYLDHFGVEAAQRPNSSQSTEAWDFAKTSRHGLV